MISHHASLHFLSKLSTLSLQRNQEKQALVEELEERIELLDRLESNLSKTLNCFPEELVNFLENHRSISSLAEFAAEFNVDPLKDTQTELLMTSSQRLEKLWQIENQLGEERRKKYEAERLLRELEALRRVSQTVISDFKAEQSSGSQTTFDQERRALDKVKRAFEGYQANSGGQPIDVTHEEIVELGKKVASLKAQVQQEQLQLDTYQTLPQDPVFARIVLDGAKEKLRKIDAERDSLLRDMKFV
ncbi:hypothetical protein GpartN1_g4560.t1 [Galdieria partita]|uniref:Uncharacterized protein n=1 Tax=Galdieria partita TaxID=83374 RepID=A0A9C7PZ08_9RHOD|nr:hypothetical protein GpartN1_g4560.t1 [Galdieria partita]